MPTPFQILIDPISLGIIAIYFALITLETLFPGRELPTVNGWKFKALISFIIYFYLATYLPLIWDKYLFKYQLMDLSTINTGVALIIGVLVFELLIYIWHRAMHNTKWLWLGFHQMHHSAERVDAYGAYYFSPMDMVGFTMIGSLSLALIVGLPPQTITLFLFVTTFLAIFQHTNIHTPHWLGYIIQRPESHSIHHKKGVHAYNYSDLPIFDIIFGTFNNPKNFAKETGFYNGASSRIVDLILFRDIYKP
ncbi:MAG: sterol desaturase family protein [Alcanivoracaceae bacterium]|nr:sterol desaturase family protein [Alcanivoracaceae bacterium]